MLTPRCATRCGAQDTVSANRGRGPPERTVGRSTAFEATVVDYFLHMYAYASSGRVVALIDEKIAELTKAMVRYQ